jgi:hypothetical protein
MSEQSPKPGDFVERISAVLRQPERLDATFEERLVAALRAQSPSPGSAGETPAPATHGSWWRRPMTIRFSPLVGLAAAASCAAVISLATLGTTRLTPVVAVAPAAPETVHVVRFVLVDRAARSVALVGDFNAWKPDKHVATPGDNGAWTISVPLTRGRHEYAFIVDGERWTPDPFAPPSVDEFDTRSSVITIGE